MNNQPANRLFWVLTKLFPLVYRKWSYGTRFPDLIDAVFFVSGARNAGADPLILNYSVEEERFVHGAGSGPGSELMSDVSWLKDGSYRIVSDRNNLMLVIPIERYEQLEELDDLKEKKLEPVPIFAGNLIVLLNRKYFAGEVVATLFDKYLGARADSFSFAAFDENSDTILFTSPDAGKKARQKIATRDIDLIVSLTAWISAENSLLTDVLSATDDETFALSQYALKAQIGDLFIRQWYGLKRDFRESQRELESKSPEGAARDSSAARSERGDAEDERVVIERERSEGINLYIWHSDGNILKAARSERNRLLAIGYSVLICFALFAVVYYLLYRRAKNLRDREHEFVATVTHELRTPVTAVNAAADNLIEGIIREPAEIEEYGKAILDQGKRLRNLIDQILLYAGLSGTKTNSRWEPIQLDEFVRNVASRVPGMPSDRLIVHVQPELPLYAGDKIAVETVITNLLSNAAKHAGEKATITLNVNRETARARSLLVIRVSDSGIGISKRELGKITEPFYRGEASRENQVPGSGLGLSLVRRIVRTYRGTVSIDSIVGRGTIVTVRLPFELEDSSEGV